MLCPFVLEGDLTCSLFYKSRSHARGFFFLLTSELSQQSVPWQKDRTPDPYTTVVLYINVNLNIIKNCLRGLQTAVKGEKIHKREARSVGWKQRNCTRRQTAEVDLGRSLNLLVLKESKMRLERGEISPKKMKDREGNTVEIILPMFIVLLCLKFFLLSLISKWFFINFSLEV